MHQCTHFEGIQNCFFFLISPCAASRALSCVALDGSRVKYTKLMPCILFLQARHLLPEEGCARGVTQLQGLTTSIHGRA